MDQDGGQRLGEGIGAEVLDNGPIALAGLEQADQLEDPDGVADGGPADAEPLGQLAFRGQSVAGVETAVDDEPADPFGNLFVDLGPPDGFQLADDRRRWCGDS